MNTAVRKISVERSVVAALTVALGWPMLASALAGFGLSFAVALIVAAVPFAAAWLPLARGLPGEGDGGRPGHGGASGRGRVLDGVVDRDDGRSDDRARVDRDGPARPGRGVPPGRGAEARAGAPWASSVK